MPDEDPFIDDGPVGPPLPPEDRLWRHPSEVTWAGVQDPPPPRSRPWGVALVAGLTGAAVTLGVVALAGGLAAPIRERVVERVPADQASIALAVGGRGDGVPAVAAAVAPSVVRLEITAAGGQTSGSGVVLRDDGTLVTAAHLVADATGVTIVRGDGAAVRGRVAASDLVTGVAVVVPDDAEAGHAWSPAVLGSAEALAVGQTAIAVGAPDRPAAGPSVTVGVVSGLGRRVSTGGFVLHGVIETDAAVSGSSSGGALCDAFGAVVGITVAVPNDEGLGFAIPADVVRSVAEALLSGEMQHAWLGIEGADLPSTESSLPGITGMGGVRVLGVEAGGPADGAGIRPGDVVLALDGQRVGSMSELIVALRSKEPGDVVLVELRRDGQDRTVEVTLGERPGSE